jgi:hypothetical protein
MLKTRKERRNAGILHRVVWYVATDVSKSPSTLKVAFLGNIGKPHQSIRYNSPENNNEKKVQNFQRFTRILNSTSLNSHVALF